MRRTNAKQDIFIRAYCAAYKAGLTREEFADSIGVKSLTVYQRAWAINADRPGTSLPLLPISRPTDTGALIAAELREDEEQEPDGLIKAAVSKRKANKPKRKANKPLTDAALRSILVSYCPTDEDIRNLEALGLNLENS